jgi:hypothetical protein
VAKEGDGSEAPITVCDALRNTVANSGDSIALRVQRDGRWLEWTWNEYYSESCKFAKSCMAAGLQKHEVAAPLGVESCAATPKPAHIIWMRARLRQAVNGRW